MKKFDLNDPRFVNPANKRFRSTYSLRHHADGNEKACWCGLCDAPVTKELFGEEGDKRSGVRVWHHGCEDWRELTWNSDSETLQDAMDRIRNQPFFVDGLLDAQTNVTQLGDSNQ